MEQEYTDFYLNYVDLCAKVKKSCSAVAEELGLSRTAPNGWKKKKVPNDTTKAKISNYFGISQEELMVRKKPSTEASEKPTNEYETKILNAVRSVPVEYQDVLLNMILSVAQTLKESPGLPLSDLLRQE